MSTVGLAIGAVVLAVGLVLIFLPLNYSSSQTFYSNYTNFSASGCGFVALQIIPVPTASYSLGGASITISWQVIGANNATAYLYPLSQAQQVQQSTGQGCGANALGSQTVYTSSDALTVTSLTPGNSYGLLYYLQNPNATSSAVATTWTGSMFLPYAELGIPLSVTGAVVLIIAVAISRPKPVQEEEVTEYPAGAPAENFELAPMLPPSPEPLVVEQRPVLPPSSPPPRALSAPPSEAFNAPAPSGPAWSARPVGRLGADRSSVVSQTQIAPGRPAIATAGESTSLPAPAEEESGGPEVGKCPRCRLSIPDESWAFCPRCRMELE
jgi:hypothetical protein